MGVTPSALIWSRTKRSGWAPTLRPSNSSSTAARRSPGQSGRKLSGAELLVEGEARLVEAAAGVSPLSAGAEPGRRSPCACSPGAASRRPRAGVQQRRLRDQLLAAHAERVEGAEPREVLGDLAADPRARDEVGEARCTGGSLTAPRRWPGAPAALISLT